MTVGELKVLLSKHPDDMQIIYEKYSDYDILEARDIRCVEALRKSFYVMRSHSTLSEDDKKKVSTFLSFPGN